MTVNSTVHPQLVYNALLDNAKHPAKRANLQLLYSICSERHKLGVRDFSLGSIAKSFEERGGLKGKALWNTTSTDYHALVAAWKTYAGGPVVAEASKPSVSNEALLRSVADPAARIVIEKIIRERDRFLAELNIAKQHANIVIDKRPKNPSTSESIGEGKMTLEVRVGPELNALELEALSHAASDELLHAEGWREERLGRVVKDLGDGRSRTIFKPGFITAIRKVIAAQAGGTKGS